MIKLRVYMIFLVWLLGLLGTLCAHDVAIMAKQRAKIKVCIVTLPDLKIKEIGCIVQHDLSWSRQFEVDLLECERLYSRREIKELGASGYPLIIFLSRGKHDALDWRLYDASEVLMLEGKRIQEVAASNRGAAHRCADSIWQALTGVPGSFSSKLVYCKEKKAPHLSRAYKHLYIADYDGSHARIIVSAPTVSLAPRWNRGASQSPLIFYSECTPYNLRLMAVNMDGKRRVMSNFSGLNMAVAWAPDGKRAVLCLSRDGAAQLYLHQVSEDQNEKKSLEKLTSSGLNVSPCFMNDHEVLFCSDSNMDNKPYLSLLDLRDKKIKTLVKGYCSSPSYCPRLDKIAYCKRKNGVLQLFVYHYKTGVEQQLTFDVGNKDTCCWSPCGSYLVFALEDGVSSRIGVYHFTTGARWFITPPDSRCSYPAVSPVYEVGAYIE